MILFCLKYFDHASGSFQPGLCEMFCTSCILPQKIGKLQWIAERVDLILSLPEFRFHFCTVILETIAVGAFIKSVGIGICKNTLCLFPDQSCDHFQDFRFLLCEKKERTELAAGISQPHSRNISCDHEYRTIVKCLNCSGQCIGNTVFEHYGNLVFFSEFLFHCLDHCIYCFISACHV